MVRTAIKFGVFGAACLFFALLLAASIKNTSIPGLLGRGPGTYTVTASFEDASGLLRDDNVKIAGVPIGKVTGVKVAAGRAVVTMEIRNEHQLSDDTTASIRWRNLIGQRYVYLAPGDSPTKLGDKGEITVTTPVVDLGSLFNELGPIVEAIDPNQVNDFLDSVSGALEGNEESLQQTLRDLATLTNGVADRDAAIGRLLVNLDTVSATIANRDVQLQQLLENLVLLSQTFSDNTDVLDQAIVELQRFGTDFSSVLEGNRVEIDRLLTNLSIVTDEAVENLEPLRRALDQLDDTAAGIFNTSKNGEFLNQTILCAAVTPPPCAYPLISGLAGITGLDATAAVPYRQDPEGADALVAILGGRSS